MNTLTEQVHAYQANPTTETRNAIVERMLPFIRKCVGQSKRKQPRAIDDDDAMSSATLAIIKLLDAIPPDVRDFEAFAASRIYGDVAIECVRQTNHASRGKVDYSLRRGESVPSYSVVMVESDDGTAVNVVDLKPDPVARVSMPEAAEQFEQFMTVIAPAQQQVMRLHYLQDKTVREIAVDVELEVSEVQRLIEDAHRKIRDYLVDFDGLARSKDMKLNDDLMEYVLLAISQASLQRKKPEQILSETLRRAPEIRVSFENHYLQDAVAQGQEVARRRNPSFIPPPDAVRQPPRGLDAINAASVARYEAIFDRWMVNGRKLGDCTAEQLAKAAASEKRRAHRHTGRCVFYETLAGKLDGGKTVRESMKEADAQRLHAEISGGVTQDIAPKQQAAAGV